MTRPATEEPRPGGRLRRRPVRAGLARGGAVLLTLVLASIPGPAIAAPSGPPAPAPPAAGGPYFNTVACVGSRTTAAPAITIVSAAQQRLDFTSAWSFSEGAGISVAVIDTGVRDHPSLAGRLTGAFDQVVPADDSLIDCDGHGTLVAGLIAGAPDPVSGFSGVAPKASILSIRQSSSRYENKPGNNVQPSPPGNLDTLADSITYATAQHVSVINISETSCAPRGVGLNDLKLRAAVAAAAAADIVIVVAAGNVSGQSSAGTSGTCATQNFDGRPPVTLASPADLPGVLAVAAVDPQGVPASFSLVGPWVNIAAPGTGIISLDPSPGGSGLVDQEVSADGNTVNAIQGTSFATPYVAGVVALVRSRFPQLSAAEVISRIERTAQHPAGGRNDTVGYGIIDPVAAVTEIDQLGARPAAVLLPAPLAPVVADRSSRDRALLISALVCVVGLVLILLVAQVRRRSAPLRLPSGRDSGSSNGASRSSSA